MHTPSNAREGWNQPLWRSLLMIVSIAHIEKERLDTYQTSVGGGVCAYGKKGLYAVAYRLHTYDHIQISYGCI